MQKLSNRLTVIPASGTDYLPFVARTLDSGNVAVVVAKDNDLDLAQLSCKITVAIRDIAFFPVAAYILPKNSTYRRNFENRCVCQIHKDGSSRNASQHSC